MLYSFQKNPRRGGGGGNVVNFYMPWYLCLLVLLLLVTARTVTSNDDDIMDLDHDSFAVPTPGPTDNDSEEPVYASGEASSPGIGNKAPDITPYLNVHPLPVPTNGGESGQSLPVPTVPSSAEKTPDQDSGSFSQGAYPTESLHGGGNSGLPKTRNTGGLVGGVGGAGEDLMEPFSEGVYPSESVTTNDDSAATGEKVPTLGPARPHAEKKSASFSEGAYPSDSMTKNDDTATGEKVPTLGPAHPPTEKKSASFSEGAYPSDSMTKNDDTAAGEKVPTLGPAHPPTEKKSASFSEGAYPSDSMTKSDGTATDEKVPTLGPAHPPTEKKSGSSFGNGAYPSTRINENKPKDTPTVYPKEPSVYPEQDQKEEDTASFSEGAYPPGTIATDKPKDTPTVYPKEPSVYPEDAVDSSEDVTKDPPVAAEKGTNDEKESKPDAPAKEGSLASFFEKVNKKKEKTQDNLSDTFAAASQVYTAQAKREGLHIGDTKKTYRGVWGELQPNHRRPNMMVLFELFQDAFVEAITGSHSKAQAEALVDDMGEILESKTAPVDVDKIMAAEPDKVEISNTFVDGLDDIDKLFEDVDPPDELDIASFGSSMQEILTGRAIHIARKRLMMGVEFVKKSFVKTKVVVVKRFTSEDGRIRLMTKDELKQAGHTTVKVLKKSYTFVKELVVDLLVSGEEETGTDESIILGDIQEQLQKQKRAVPS
eukprot:scaffold569_cov165-Amphora_coffeaeformis.AAC.8